MLAARRRFTVLDEPFRTPLIVPSYSSRAVEDEVTEVIDATLRFVTGSILVSAYDIKNYRVKQKQLSNARLVFLDCGGYEAGSKSDLSEIEDPRIRRPKWTIGQYREIICNWDFTSSTVLISYDEPYHRVSLDTQISRAEKNLQTFPNACHCILLKPEPIGRRLRRKERVDINIDRITNRLEEIKRYGMIGVAEKELGNSIFARMKAIAKLRKALAQEEIELPIHIFGSLDPISTPLYFLSGADVFDGLTWLRYAYHDGLAIYRQNFIARDEEIPHDIMDGSLSLKVQVHNYFALGKLQETLIQFLQNSAYRVFGPNAEFLKNAMEKLEQEIGGW